MKRLSLYLLFALQVSLAGAQILPNLGGQRAGNSALSFLKLDVSPRSTALGGASLALPADGYAIFVNPAQISKFDGWNITTSTNQSGTGTQQGYLSGIIPLENSAALGVSLDYFGSGPVEVRTEFNPMGTGETVFAGNTAVGLTYAKQLSEMFTIGLTGRYVNESLAEYSAHTATFDLAFFYQTDWNNLAFAVMVQNFGGQSTLSGDFIEESFNRDTASFGIGTYGVPTVFRLGTTLDLLNTDPNILRFSFELQHPGDNAENFRFGFEYQWKEIFYGRLGYKLNVKGQTIPSLGIGLRTMAGSHPLMIDYAALPTNYMGMVHSVGLSFTFNKVENRDE